MKGGMIIGVILLSYTLSAQRMKRKDKLELKKASVYVKLNEYQLAYNIVDSLESKFTNNADISLIKGICANKLSNHKANAEGYLKKALDLGEHEANFYLCEYYLYKADFKEASHYLDVYTSSQSQAKSYDEIEKLRSTIKEARLAYADESLSRISNLGEQINSRSSDYMPVLSPDGSVMLYTSVLEGNENIYQSEWASNNWGKSDKLGAPINTKTHDATVAFLQNGESMVIYRTNEFISGGNLMLSEYKDNQWSSPLDLDFGLNSEYQESSAWFSSDNDLIYFSSNRPGGYGGKDIYRLIKMPNGEWSLPYNLGPTINSPLDDDGPFYDEDNQVLYFMSQGHNSMGGFDIYKSHNNDNTWESAENLGYPINSTADDIYISLAKQSGEAYLSSDRDGGYGGHDIYSFKLTKDEVLDYRLVRATVSFEGEPASAKITVLDVDKNIVKGIYNSNAVNGSFVMMLDPGGHYKLIIESKGRSPHVEELSCDAGGNPEEIAFKQFKIGE